MAKYHVLTLTDDEHVSLPALVQQGRVAGQQLMRAQWLLAIATTAPGLDRPAASPGLRCERPPAGAPAPVGVGVLKKYSQPWKWQLWVIPPP